MPESLELYGALIDAAGDAHDEDALVRATEMTSAVEAACSGWHVSWARYCLSNAWAELYRLRRYPHRALSWQQAELRSQIFHLRSALQHEAIDEMDSGRRAQIHCNLGNALDATGRVIDAIEQWEAALQFNPVLAMARGNLGKGLAFYARTLYDDGHQLWLVVRAREHLQRAVQIGLGRDGATYPAALKHFEAEVHRIEKLLASTGVALTQSTTWMQKSSLGSTKREREYRTWCLQRKLFLNPMNDAYIEPVAACDVLSLPTHRGEGVGIKFLAFFNQMKQEYAYARWCLFDGTTSTKVHWADHDVKLSFNVDHARYSVALEQVKTAFRAAYSLLDKVAYFVNSYFQLNIDEKKVDFKSVWTEQKRPNVGQVREVLENSKNISLQALYWLSQDIYDDKTHEVALPDARSLKDLRNHLEHKFLKVVDLKSDDDGAPMFRDDLAHQVTPEELTAKAERVLKISRSALIYLCLAMHRAETLRPDDRSDVVHFEVADLPDRFKY